jgi:putative flippase GtrA
MRLLVASIALAAATLFGIAIIESYATVRRQSFRDGRHPDLVESLAHAV